METERNSTMAVLLDVGAERKRVDEDLERLGNLAAKSSDVPDGLKPQLGALAEATIAQVLRDPTWANTLYAATICTITTDEPEKLRDYLIQVANVAVHWAEVIDERSKA